jgi:NADH-quinone oxidoreductase subunit E
MVKKHITDKYSPDMENLLLILTEIQENNPQHYIRDEDMIWVAGYLNTTLSAVYGVVKYYSMFSTRPRGRYVTRVCRSPVCTMKADKTKTVSEDLETLLNVSEGQVTPDGLFSVERVECLGQCEKAPAMMINEEVYGNLDHEKLVKIIDVLKRKI